MSKVIILITFILLIFSDGLIAQPTSGDNGSINIHFGTLMVYNTFSVGYESFDLLKNRDKHQLCPVIRIGGWNSSLLEKNSGIQSSIGLSYIFGSGNHFIEYSSEFVFHFDKGLKEQPIVYIGSLFRPFLGYRYQNSNNRFITKIGFGWKELIQIGFGYIL